MELDGYNDFNEHCCECCGVVITPENCQYGFVFCDDCDRMLDAVHRHNYFHRCSINDSVKTIMPDKPKDQQEFAAEWWTS